MMQRSVCRSGATLLLLALVACAKAGVLPVAVLGADQSVATGAVVTLDGSGSKDAAGNTTTQGGKLRFQWSFVKMPAGSRATFALADTPNPTFKADVPGPYLVQLVVRIEDYASDPAQSTITAADCGSHHPTVGTLVATPANAGVGVSVKLTAPEVADLDNGPSCNLKKQVSYRWSITSQPAGSRARLSDGRALSPIFTPDVAGNYLVHLTVSDSTGLATTQPPATSPSLPWPAAATPPASTRSAPTPLRLASSSLRSSRRSTPSTTTTTPRAA